MGMLVSNVEGVVSKMNSGRRDSRKLKTEKSKKVRTKRKEWLMDKRRERQQW